ncbi:hypothetical protein K9L97_05775 [Candidatus Woesearchaeota archaeon]|nr:hypothetical protein [Candidatus Woesearchaeota archaeon]
MSQLKKIKVKIGSPYGLSEDYQALISIFKAYKYSGSPLEYEELEEKRKIPIEHLINVENPLHHFFRYSTFEKLKNKYPELFQEKPDLYLQPAPIIEKILEHFNPNASKTEINNTIKEYLDNIDKFENVYLKTTEDLIMITLSELNIRPHEIKEQDLDKIKKHEQQKIHNELNPLNILKIEKQLDNITSNGRKLTIKPLEEEVNNWIDELTEIYALSKQYDSKKGINEVNNCIAELKKEFTGTPDKSNNITKNILKKIDLTSENLNLKINQVIHYNYYNMNFNEENLKKNLVSRVLLNIIDLDDEIRFFDYYKDHIDKNDKTFLNDSRNTMKLYLIYLEETYEFIANEINKELLYQPISKFDENSDSFVIKERNLFERGNKFKMSNFPPIQFSETYLKNRKINTNKNIILWGYSTLNEEYKKSIKSTLRNSFSYLEKRIKDENILEMNVILNQMINTIERIKVIDEKKFIYPDQYFLKKQTKSNTTETKIYSEELKKNIHTLDAHWSTIKNEW